jgi:FkbM family methyltransferase
MKKSFSQNYMQTLFHYINQDCRPFKSIFLKKSFLPNKTYIFEKLISFVIKLIFKNNYYVSLFAKDNYIQKNIEKFELIYNCLCDEFSKDRFCEYIVSKTLANRQLNIDLKHTEIVKKTLSILKKNHKLNYSNFSNQSVFDLSPIGFDANFIGSDIAVLINFLFKQYDYRDYIKVIKGDVVIDCGGGEGDTAIYFAAKGAEKIFVFEFINSNIEIINKQIKLNPKYKNIIEIVDKPVWSDTDVELSYLYDGFGSRVGDKSLYPNLVKTMSIDDLVIKKKLSKVDFIKMDVEGAEMSALNGAINTIKKYKPKLAICAYHKKDDLITITNLILKINPKYKIYFDYYTDIGWEAVLYAIDDS